MGIDPLQVLLFLLGFGLILFMAYMTTKFLAGKSGRAMKGKHIQIVETISLGMDKRIHLIKAGKQYVLIAATSKRIEYLTDVNLDNDISKQENGSAHDMINFKNILGKYINAYRNKRDGKMSPDREDTGVSGEYDFKENLGRLKSIIQRAEIQDEKDAKNNTNEE